MVARTLSDGGLYGDGLRSQSTSNAANMTLHPKRRNEEVIEVLSSEIDGLKRRIMHLHLVAPWNETILGASIGLITSAVFGLVGFYQTVGAPRWVEIVMIAFLAGGVVATALCLLFRKNMATIEEEQKNDLIEELDRWKRDSE
ncbi:hypothetical protein [Bifidobacterium goeldii]|uniref:hypothetical protein n=1 Tax=Bifidobacterium goeldii TaxID=2306975 RepID=UPI000F7F1FA8|nr:hypothetical protein [Bifidobacterium goeldii]